MSRRTYAVERGDSRYVPFPRAYEGRAASRALALRESRRDKALKIGIGLFQVTAGVGLIILSGLIISPETASAGHATVLTGGAAILAGITMSTLGAIKE